MSEIEFENVLKFFPSYYELWNKEKIEFKRSNKFLLEKFQNYSSEQLKNIYHRNINHREHFFYTLNMDFDFYDSDMSLKQLASISNFQFNIDIYLEYQRRIKFREKKEKEKIEKEKLVYSII